MIPRVLSWLVLLSIGSITFGQTPCNAPATPSIVFAPPTDVAVGQTYSIAWQDLLSSDPDGTYLAERSSSPSFATDLESQQTTSTSVSFLALAEGTLFHRVRAIAGCDAAKISAPSATRAVHVAAARPNVVITVQPHPVFLNVGESSVGVETTFVIENISNSTVTIKASGQGIQTPPFFTVVDPDAVEASEITLSPREPKTLKIVFSNVNTATVASYQGFVAILDEAEPLVVTPFAFVNLKVGASDAATPQFRFKGVDTEYAFFDGYSATLPAAAHPTITVQVRNPGSTPMQLGGEVGPEAWLIPATGWNVQPVTPGGTIDVVLSVDRTRAAAGSPLPRYTYFTVRTRNGQSARLLVQDNDAPSQANGRQDPVASGVRSYIVPYVVTRDGADGRAASRIRLSNVGSASLNAEIFFTPAGVDGRDARVQRATIAVPPNDGVTLTDPLHQIFGLASGSGQLEVRTTADRVASLTVTAETMAAVAGGGSSGYPMPVVIRGEGARIGAPQAIAGLASSATRRATLVLAETTGISEVRGRALVFDGTGASAGEVAFRVPRNGEVAFADLGAEAHIPSSLGTGRLEIRVEGGDGAVVGVLLLSDTQTPAVAVLVSQTIGSANSAAHLRSRLRSDGASAGRYVIGGIANGKPTPSVASASTVVILSSTATSDAHFDLLYVDATRFLSATRDVPRLGTVEIPNVMENVFGITQSTVLAGTIVVDATNGGTVSARLVSSDGSAVSSVGSSLPVVGVASEALTSAQVGMRRPVCFDGLEQSIDPTRGRRWDLLLTEIANYGATLNVRLYEAGNRTSPIAQKNVVVLPMQQMRMSTIFAELGLDTERRRKDRTNVQVVVTPISGFGTILAVATGTDNRTGATTMQLLTPSGGVPATGVTRPPPETDGPAKRRRSVGR